MLIPTLLLVSIIVFLTVRLMPGSVINAILSNMGLQSEPINMKNLEHALGLDVPVFIQYGRWIRDLIVHGNFGTSLYTGRSVTGEILVRIPVTFELGLLSVIIANLVAFPVGIYSALRQNSWLDFSGRSIAILFLAAPAFWLASMLIVYGAVYWQWSPRLDYISIVRDPVENFKMMILPAFLVGMSSAGAMMRGLRTITLEVVRQDYVRTAWAKGLRERVIVIRHAIRNALIPMVTMLAPQLSLLVGGTVIMEQIFDIPGMGRYLLSTIVNRDYTAVAGVNIVFATFTMLIVLLTDISYAWLDPRVRYR